MPLLPIAILKLQSLYILISVFMIDHWPSLLLPYIKVSDQIRMDCSVIVAVSGIVCLDSCWLLRASFAFDDYSLYTVICKCTCTFVRKDLLRLTVDAPFSSKWMWSVIHVASGVSVSEQECFDDTSGAAHSTHQALPAQEETQECYAQSWAAAEM